MRPVRRLLPWMLLIMLPGVSLAQDFRGEEERPGLTTKDWILLGSGAGTLLLARAFDVEVRDVPPEGLDPAEISLDWDREALGGPETGALTPSDILEGVSLLYPPVITAVTAEEGTFWDSQIRSGWIQVESVVLGVGASQLLKHALSRPRPYAYLDEASRPDDAHYDVTRDDAFVSMPSGHATVAWSSTMTGMTLLVLERPDLPFLGHFAGGFVAGALATSTSVLRVEGEVHHPTDVLAGAALGSAVGIGVPLLHDRGSDTSRGPAWKAALLGLAAGTAASLLVVPRL